MSDLLADIAPAQALQISVSRHWKNGIELAAPLAANINDKGTAFAGSISSLLTLAGWALITRELKQEKIQAEVMVVESSTTYSAAVRADLKSIAEVSEKEIARVLKDLETRGRSRIFIESSIPGHASMNASFAIRSYSKETPRYLIT
ncbi:YiiD C-terminal domain-containing protein [Pontiellaceae bacterium B1224]|nr:YiiD C-terminal domain-containing protein [Pontiellaceae bacterium B1224]